MMTEEKRTIHVLKDEKLGIDREYVAVDRKAARGETIVIVEDLCPEDSYSEGDIFNVDGVESLLEGVVYAVDAGSPFNPLGLISRGTYRVLEPTDIVHIDGERYRLEDRKAEVGEQVIYVNKESGESDGIDTVVTSIGTGRVDVCIYKDDSGEDVCSICHGDYYVLTPVQDDPEPKESDVITVLANLGAEVAELKRAVTRHQAEINALHEDKVRLGEQLAKVIADEPKALTITTDELAQIIVSLSRAGL